MKAFLWLFMALAFVAIGGCGGGEPLDQTGRYDLAGGDGAVPAKVFHVQVYGPVSEEAQARALLRIQWQQQITQPAFVAVTVQMINPAGPQKVVFSRLEQAGTVAIQIDDAIQGAMSPGEKTQVEVWVQALDTEGQPMRALGRFEAVAEWVLKQPT